MKNIFNQRLLLGPKLNIWLIKKDLLGCLPAAVIVANEGF